MATRGGLEPPMREPKSLVLPLHHRVAILSQKILNTQNTPQDLFYPAANTAPLSADVTHLA